ncbi:MAG TPA: putative Ig domain-containing protein, partial [Candidatus Paceibacterota bacterium]|nr:putative Ig domain-containing protein [Candidatus Paceibacterota bacterium]
MDGSIQIIPVVMVQFLPTPDGKNLDTTKAPDFWWDNPKTIKQIREEINLFTHRSKFILEEGSRFRAYKNPGARPSLGYKVIASYTFYQHTPAGPYSWVNPDGIRAWFLDYEQIMAAINARHFVEDLGVREFWIWHGYFDGDFPCFKANPGGFRLEDARGLQESNMSSPTTGDISNSGRFNDLPIYRNTYIVYEYNLRRSHCEAIENHMHQLEVMLSHVYEVREGSSDFFWSIFVGGNSTQRIMGRCGWSHMPPNTIENYDWFNKTVVFSDIADWRPDGAGERQAVDFNTWMGREYNWPLSPAPAPDSSYWFIYWMQSMPGFTNGIPNGTKGIPNWWQFTADWDQTLTRDISAPVLLAGPQSQDVALGGTVELSALGTGHGLRYQWMLNGRNVLGGTNATLRLENVTYAAAGTYAVELVNLGGSVITTPVTLTVNGVSSAPTITTETLPKARCETPFTFSLQGSEGIPPYRWEWIGGHLPEGMSLSSDGTLSGIPAFAGTFVFVVQLTDLQTIKVTKELTLTVREIRSRVRVAGRTIHTLALQTDGRLYAWGGNTEGQLGQGTTSNSSQPLAVGSDTDWIEVASGENHSMALKRDGTLWIWGGNNRGQLGNNSTARSTRPTRLGAAEWATIAAGAEYSLAVKTNGTLWAWGRNEVGQLGLGHTTDVRIPTQVGNAADWHFVAASAAASLGQRTNGTLWAWGDNYFGRLGNGSYSHTQVPVRMSAVQDWMDASLGYGHGAGIMSDGTVWTWGWNSSGQLGDGGHSDRNVPAEVEPSGSWKAIVAGAEHTLGIQVDGSLWAWGNNSNGKLGDGTLINRSVPTRIGSMTNWSALGLSIESSFAIQSDGSVWAWGLNSWGQLGDKTTVNRLQPVKILPLPAPPSISSIPEQYMVMNRTHSVSFSVRDTGTAA